jgi:Trk K+ transport system NAD-binding subunit
MVRKVYNLMLLALTLLALYSITFIVLMRYEGQLENADLATAIYWVAATMTTVGYGDVVFRSDIGRYFSVLVSLSGISILWAVIVPLGVTPNLERLVRASPTSAPAKMREHIIISGFNSTVESLTERLRILDLPFVIIERSEETARKIYMQYPVLFGDPSSLDTLQKANIGAARLFIANESEELNAEVIMTVRELSEIDIIALVEDLSRSRFLSYAGASRIISPKTLLGTFLAQITSPPKKNIFPGAVQLFGELKLVELPIYPDSSIIGKSLGDQSIKSTGAQIIGIWQRGLFVPRPSPVELIKSNSVLLAVGDIEQLVKIRDLTLGPRKSGHLIILGFGDVGRRVAKVLCDNGIKPVIIDRRDLAELPLKTIPGDATSEANLIQAGIREAVGTLILLNRDSDTIYATLQIKNLNPMAFVVARANHVRSAEKIYRAGADYVASVPVIASHMLAKIIQKEEEELAPLYEDLELKIFTVSERSSMANKTLMDIDLEGRFGCAVAAVARGGEVTAELDSGFSLEIGDILALAGKPEGIRAFMAKNSKISAVRRASGLVGKG